MHAHDSASAPELEPEATGQVDAATTETAFRFQVQSEFHPIPLGLGVDEETFDEQIREFARDYWGEQEDLEPIRRFTAAMYSANSQQLAADGTVYHALGIFPIGGTADGSQPPERISRGTLTVSVQDLDNPSPHLAAAGIAETLDKGEESGEVQLIDLPAGRLSFTSRGPVQCGTSPMASRRGSSCALRSGCRSPRRTGSCCCA